MAFLFVTFLDVKAAVALRTLALLTAATLTLAACSSASPESPPGSSDAPDAATAPPAEPSVTEPAAPEPAEPVGALPTTCADVPTLPDATVDGKVLGTCVVDAMTTAGTGRMVVDDGSFTNTVDFRFDPKYSAYVTGGPEGDMGMILREDTGWLLQEGVWKQEGNGDPLVDAVVGLGRGFSDPLMIKNYLGLCGTWSTEGSEGGQTRYDCEKPFEFIGVTLSDVWFTVDESFLGVESVATGSMGGISATTTQTFSNWGAPVEIPEPS